MTPLSSPRRACWLVSLLGVSGLAPLGGACTGPEADDEHVDSADSALTAEQCDGGNDIDGAVEVH